MMVLMKAYGFEGMPNTIYGTVVPPPPLRFGCEILTKMLSNKFPGNLGSS